MDAYNEATAKPYGYLLVDCKPQTQDTDRLLANALTETTVPDLYSLVKPPNTLHGPISSPVVNLPLVSTQVVNVPVVEEIMPLSDTTKWYKRKNAAANTSLLTKVSGSPRSARARVSSGC